MENSLPGHETKAPPPHPVVLVCSRWFALMMVALSAGLIAMGVAYARASFPHEFIAWVFVAFGCFGLLWNLWLAIRPPEIHLDSSGITLMRVRLDQPIQRYRWQDIQGFFTWNNGRVVFTAFNVEPHLKRHSALARFHRSAGGPDQLLSRGWELKPTHLVDYLNAYQLKALASQQATASADLTVAQGKMGVH